MTTPDLMGVLRSLASHTGGGMPVIPLAVCAQILGVDGLAITLRTADGDLELVRYSNQYAALVDDVQYTQNRGPTPDAAQLGAPVLLPDIAVGPDPRWPGLLPDMQQLGIRALFALPMRLQGALRGALTAHRRTPGVLTPEQWKNALVLTHTITCLARRCATDLQSPVTWLGQPNPLHRAAVHRAAGVVAAELGTSATNALLRIKAHSYGQNQHILATADCILGRHLRLEKDPPQHT